MRLIASISSYDEGQKFSRFLSSEGIKNSCDKGENGENCQIWIFEEDDVALSKQWYEEFVRDPNDLWFHTHGYKEKEGDVVQVSAEVNVQKQSLLQAAESGFITYTLLITCVALFLLGELGFEFGESHSWRDEAFGGYNSIEKVMMYDIPRHPRAYWHGVYREAIVRKQLGIQSLTYEGPMFEKIKEGQIWRLFTPALLHGSLLHICFNLLWLHVLGKQMEIRLGIFRFSLFIVITALVSNFFQYIMSGFQFVGLSGVICGMVGYVWMRLDYAAWEGYDLPRSTLRFLTMFILGVAAVQTIFFVVAMSGGGSHSTGIANAAHIMGGVSGAILGRMEYFAWKR